MEKPYHESVDSYDDDSPKKDRRQLDAGSLDRPVRSLPLRKPICLDVSSMVQEAVKVMRTNKTGSVLVVRSGRLAGIFTERDILNRMSLGEIDPTQVSLGEMMRANPETLSPEAPMAYALNLMSVGGFRHVPLVDEEGRPVGVVSVRDIVDYLVDHFPDKVLNLPPAGDQGFPSAREGA